MNLVWAALIIVVASGIAVAAMLLVRRKALDGGRLSWRRWTRSKPRTD